MRHFHFAELRRIALIPALLYLLCICVSCSVTRNVSEDEMLLNHVRIAVEKRILKSELKTLVRQKENRRILWAMRFKLRFFSSFIFKKESDAKIRYTIGEAPVIYDSSLTGFSARQMKAFLRNKGYYHNEVETKERIHGRGKKVNLTYRITPNQPTIIVEVNYEIEDELLATVIKKDAPKSLLRPGDKFDLDVLEDERNRLTRMLQNGGYFFFSNELIFYTADTVRKQDRVYLTLKVKSDPIRYFGDSIPVKPYRTYRLRNVYVRQNFDEGMSDRDTTDQYSYLFINQKEFKVRPKVISRSIFLRPTYFYILEDHENTYRRLSALNNFKYINISYQKTEGMDSTRLLDCLISLSPSKKKSFSVETNGTTTGGPLGINGSYSYMNRNTFRGAEVLRIRIAGGLEAQQVKSDNKVVKNTPFNTWEFGPEISLVFPKMLLPIDQYRYSKRTIPKSSVSVSYNYQQRPDYTRNILNTSLIYTWKESKTKTHSIQPINISQIKIIKSDQFQQRLDTINNPSLTASYSDNFITSITYGFVYNNQNVKGGSGYQIFRGNAEFAGNLVYLYDKYLVNTIPDGNGQYRFNNIPYAQFIRVYLEYIQNIRTSKFSSLNSRTFFGVGVPYGNSNSMPFVRSFYGGGTNGIRAWRARSIGPGSIPNSTTSSANVDQIGDIKIEENLEYRFKVIKFFEAAIFTDMGNIWVFEKEGYDERGFFKISDLWHDLAIGVGTGVRLNFNFFIVRFDVGKRLKDPGAENPEALKFLYPNPPVYNFAIGYPF